MKLEGYQNGLTYLNQHTIKLLGSEVSFYIHYWGIMPTHLDNPLHKHSFFEVCYVVDGEGTYMEDEVIYPLKKNTMFLTRPGVPHQIRSSTGLSLLFVAFDVIEAESTEESVQLYRELTYKEHINTFVENDILTAELWKTLIMYAAKTQIMKKEILLNLANALLSSFYQTFTNHQNRQVEKLDRTKSPLLHQAKLFIEDNLSQRLRLDDVAAYLNISNRHLTRLFSREISTESFTSYIKAKRIQKAVDLLTNSDLPIKKIADETGFSSVHYFTKVFTADMGVSPGVYRKENKT